MELTPEERAAFEHLMPSAEQGASPSLDTLTRAALEAKARRERNTTDGGHIFAAMKRYVRSDGTRPTWEEIAEWVGMSESTIRYWHRGVVS